MALMRFAFGKITPAQAGEGGNYFAFHFKIGEKASFSKL